MNRCDKCKDLGLEYKRSYKPEEFIEGKVSSDVWIVGLNPGREEGWVDGRNTIELSDTFNDLEKIHRYFKDFKKVSPSLFDRFGRENGVAHTDLVKCSSKKWPPKTIKGKKTIDVINNCKMYLFDQIRKYQPKMIICNGAPVSHQIKDVLKPDKQLSDTAYVANFEGTRIVVILSGFIGRIDDFSKRRLGYEIDKYID